LVAVAGLAAAAAVAAWGGAGDRGGQQPFPPGRAQCRAAVAGSAGEVAGDHLGQADLPFGA
jgi:hypothetical protein